MASIKIPTPLRAYTNGEATIDVDGATVGDILTDLTAKHPQLRQHIFDGETLRSFVNIFVGEDNARDLNGMDTEINENSALRIIPSIAGG